MRVGKSYRPEYPILNNQVEQDWRNSTPYLTKETQDIILAEWKAGKIYLIVDRMPGSRS